MKKNPKHNTKVTPCVFVSDALGRCGVEEPPGRPGAPAPSPPITRCPPSESFIASLTSDALHRKCRSHRALPGDITQQAFVFLFVHFFVNSGPSADTRPQPLDAAGLQRVQPQGGVASGGSLCSSAARHWSCDDGGGGGGVTRSELQGKHFPL